MREIKFRAWDKNKNKMLSHYDLYAMDCSTEYPFLALIKGYYAHSDGIDPVIMQYTGLKDKNGKEIYEGDIVRTADGSVVATIKIGECCPEPVKKFCEFRGIKSHKVYCLHAYDKNGEYLIEDNKSLEIIGNIYENPDLSEGGKL